jgi:NADH dehydrogenase FAD-containing subunit
MRRVVIIGGGFAGLGVAKALNGVAEVLVIDSKLSHTYTPWLYEVASGKRGAPPDVPFTGLKGYKHVTFIHDKVLEVRSAERVVLCGRGGSYRYDDLVIAVGAVPNDFGLPGVKEYARFLKTSDQAMSIKGEAQALFKRGEGQIVMVGAGPTGVETAAELALWGRRMGSNVKVALLDAGEWPLGAGAHPRVGKLAKDRLAKVGVEYIGQARLLRMTGTEVFYAGPQGERGLASDLTIWSGGVKANPIVQTWRLPMDERGRLKIQENFQVSGQPHVYALGDVATVVNPRTGRPDPQSAQVAVSQAHHLGRELARLCKTGRVPRPFKFPRRWELLVAIGGRYAVGDVMGLKTGGFLFYLLRQLVDRRYFWRTL